MISILILDDDPDILDSLHMLFGSEGYMVSTCSTITDMYALINEAAPDIF